MDAAPAARPLPDHTAIRLSALMRLSSRDEMEVLAWTSGRVTGRQGLWRESWAIASLAVRVPLLEDAGQRDSTPTLTSSACRAQERDGRGLVAAKRRPPDGRSS